MDDGKPKLVPFECGGDPVVKKMVGGVDLEEHNSASVNCFSLWITPSGPSLSSYMSS